MSETFLNRRKFLAFMIALPIACSSCDYRTLCAKNVALPEGKVRADLHNHLRTFSKMKKFNSYVDHVRNVLGDGGLLGVVNFSDARYEEFVSLKGYERIKIGNGNAFHVPEKNIYLVKGQEIETKSGHLLALGIPFGEHLPDHNSLEDTLNEIKSLNGLSIMDHPFYLNGVLRDVDNLKFVNQVDGIEIWNGSANLYIPGKTPFNSNNASMDAFPLLKNDFPHLGAIVSSDGHTKSEIGSSYMIIDKPDFSSSENLITSLKKSMKNLNLETDVFCNADAFFPTWHAGMLSLHRGMLKISDGKIDLNRGKSFSGTRKAL